MRECVCVAGGCRRSEPVRCVLVCSRSMHVAVAHCHMLYSARQSVTHVTAAARQHCCPPHHTHSLPTHLLPHTHFTRTSSNTVLHHIITQTSSSAFQSPCCCMAHVRTAMLSMVQPSGVCLTLSRCCRVTSSCISGTDSNMWPCQLLHAVLRCAVTLLLWCPLFRPL